MFKKWLNNSTRDNVRAIMRIRLGEWTDSAIYGWWNQNTQSRSPTQTQSELSKKKDQQYTLTAVFLLEIKAIIGSNAGRGDRGLVWEERRGFSVSVQWTLNSDYGHLIESNERGLCSGAFCFPGRSRDRSQLKAKELVRWLGLTLGGWGKRAKKTERDRKRGQSRLCITEGTHHQFGWPALPMPSLSSGSLVGRRCSCPWKKKGYIRCTVIAMLLSIKHL